MDDARIERIRGWQGRDIGGSGDLDADFTGAIDAGERWVLVLDGTCVAGDPEWLETGGTAYRAPHDALPLLFAMEDADGETQGRYYSEEVDLRETHETLSDAGFTGYVELAENVLSGDYYVVYHGGQSRSVGFQGNNGQLLTDDEAFEAAADEVGIYTVESATIDPKPVPIPTDATAADEVDADGTDDEGATAAATAPVDAGDTDAPGDGGATDTATERTGDDPAGDVATTTGTDDDRASDPEPNHADDAGMEAGDGSAAAADADAGGTATSADDPSDDGAPPGSSEPTPESNDGSSVDPETDADGATADDSGMGDPPGEVAEAAVHTAEPKGDAQSPDPKDAARPADPEDTAASTGTGSDAGEGAADPEPSRVSGGGVDPGNVAAADASGAGDSGTTPPRPGAASKEAPAALSSSGDVAAVEQTVDRIADRVTRIDRQLDEVTETLDRLADGPGDAGFAVAAEDANEGGAGDEGTAGRSRLPYLVLAVILLLAAIGAVDAFTTVTMPGMAGLREGLRSVVDLTSLVGMRP